MPMVRTGDDGACLSYADPNGANGLQEQFKVAVTDILKRSNAYGFTVRN